MDVLPPYQYHWLDIRWSTPLTVLKLPKPALEVIYVTAASDFVSTIDGRVLTPRNYNYGTKPICSDCNIIATGDASYGILLAGYATLQQVREMTERIICLRLIRAKQTVICNWAVLSSIEPTGSWAT